LNLTLNGVSNNLSIQQNTNVTINAISDNGEDLIYLFINGTLVANDTSSLSYNLSPQPGVHNISIRTNTTTNYLAQNITYQLTVIQTVFHDLKLDNLALNSSHTVNSNITTTFNITNIGNVIESSVARLYVNDVEVDNITISNILANKSRALSFTYTAPNVETDNMKFNITVDTVSQETSTSDNSITTYIDIISAHDARVDSITINKQTIYLNDNVTIFANITNLGNLAENITVNLKEDNVIIGNQTIQLNASGTTQINFSWQAQIKNYHNLLIETTLTTDTNLSNNAKSTNQRVWSVADNVNLDFVNPTRFPENVTAINSTFYVWVNLDNTAGIGNDFKDFKLTIDTDGLNIINSQDATNATTITLSNFTGDSSTSFWWQLSAGGLAATKNITVYAGDISENLNISRGVIVQ